MIGTFTYVGLPAHVIFGAGALDRLPHEVARLGLERVLVLSTPEQASQGQKIAEGLGGRVAGIFAGARMHTPVDVTTMAVAEVAQRKADGIVAIGGGSTTGLAKAIAFRTDLPQIVIPTTYAGSEVTPILGETRDGKKITQRSLKVLPEVVIYDVDLTLDLPVALSVTSGLNAIAHAAEALYSQQSNPVISLMAEDGARALVQALPGIIANPADRSSREEALYGAWLAGTCLGSVGMALHHKLCHVLGGAFDLPHAETHSVILPHALAYNLSARVSASARHSLARVLGDDDPAQALYRFAASLGAPMTLRELGMPEDGIERAADLTMQHTYWNPRPVEHDAVARLLRRAWIGAAPETN
ncbi:iron-containing alcohol dehydrogenase [Burkholderia cenocepacia]|uniref:Iron-containing alcohol dehydrogenase n=1 Tax=Burkholderia cenocepacia TaxID=95486 RepID=A0AAN0RQV4_9BURK|nr:iron-containing alcohol dehydrogenase [Burkholderia cenocepacia]